jgi:hypothetical protein
MYEVKQIVLKEKFIGQDSKNINVFEDLLNEYAKKGFVLDSFQSVFIGNSGIGGGGRQVITAVFRKIKR